MSKEVTKFIIFIMSIILIGIGIIIGYPILMLIVNGKLNTQIAILLIIAIIFFGFGLNSLINLFRRKKHGKRRK